jgi:hypothetical protein
MWQVLNLFKIGASKGTDCLAKRRHFTAAWYLKDGVKYTRMFDDCEYMDVTNFKQTMMDAHRIYVHIY